MRCERPATGGESWSRRARRWLWRGTCGWRIPGRRVRSSARSGSRTSRWGTFHRRSRTTRSAWRLRGRWGTAKGRAMQATTLVLPWKRMVICRPPRTPSCRPSPRFSAWSATWARTTTAACRCLSSSKPPTCCCRACCWGSSSRGGRWAWRRRPRDARCCTSVPPHGGQPWAQQRGPRRHGRP